MNRFEEKPFVSVVIPVRNEARNIKICLESVLNQDYEHFEVIVVDDGSTDGTLEQVKKVQEVSNKEVSLLRVESPEYGWTGKNYAIYTGTKSARGNWFLFLDADTVLYPDAISKAVNLCISNGLNMVSFSPEQVLVGFWEKAIQPVIFDFLESLYVYEVVNDPNTEEAAANGQFILVERTAYEVVGKHAAIRDEVLEDVALAKRLKLAGFRITFLYGKGIVRCRMYKSLGEIVEGWTKNLFILADYRWRLVLKTILKSCFWFSLPLLCVYMLFLFFMNPGFLTASLLLLTSSILGLFYIGKWSRFKKRGYPGACVFLYPLGAGVSVVLFCVSIYRVLIKGVRWKGRVYKVRKREKL